MSTERTLVNACVPEEHNDKAFRGAVFGWSRGAVGSVARGEWRGPPPPISRGPRSFG